jgi:hypothetical protein
MAGGRSLGGVVVEGRKQVAARGGAPQDGIHQRRAGAPATAPVAL